MAENNAVLATLADFVRWSTPFWVRAAACRNPKYRSSWWFRDGKKKLDKNLREKAKSICIYECPVRYQCLAKFMTEPHGIFGGLDEDERKQLAASMHYEARNDYTEVRLKVERRQQQESNLRKRA